VRKTSPESHVHATVEVTAGVITTIQAVMNHMNDGNLNRTDKCQGEIEKKNNLCTHEISPVHIMLEYGSVLEEKPTLLLLHPLDNSIGGPYGCAFRESG
jgi:hypothetical protein